MTCEYCDKTGYHTCIARDKAELAAAFEELHRIGRGKARPYDRPMTSDDLRLREERMQSIATGLKMNGYKVNPDYDMEVGRSE